MLKELIGLPEEVFTFIGKLFASKEIDTALAKIAEYETQLNAELAQLNSVRQQINSVIQLNEHAQIPVAEATQLNG